MEARKNKGDIIHVGSVAYMPGVEAAITFSKDLFYEDKDIKPRQLPTNIKNELNYIPWGEDNLYPMNVITEVEKNPVASPLLEFKIELSYGSGLKLGRQVDGEFKAYTKKELKSLPEVKEAAEFFSDNNINSQLSEIFTDLHWFQQVNVELMVNKGGGDKISEINSRETAFSRWSEMDNKGHVNYHIYSAKWGESIEEKDYIITKVLDFKKPQLDLKRRMGIKRWPDGKIRKDNQKRYIYPIRFSTPARRYYPSPYWHSIIKSGWLEFHNAIPIFKKTLMANTINVKWHVEVSHDYFDRIFSEEGITEKKKMEERRDQEYQNIQDFLTGAENTGKPIISYYKITPDGKVEISDIKIKAIENKIGGEYIEDTQEGSAIIYTAFRIHPNLIGVIPSKSTSNLSGSDKRELLRIAQTFQTRTREKIYELLYLIKEINKWPEELEFSITDIILTTLDQGKEVQEINTQA